MPPADTSRPVRTDRPASDVDVLDRQRLHDGFFKMDRLTLRHRRHDGSWMPPIIREVMVPYSAAAVLPYDPVADVVVLLEQFRTGAYVAGRPPWVIETVGGMVEAGETLEDVARRETREETGLSVLALEKVFSFMPTPGGVSEVITLYCGIVDASDATGIRGNAAEHEDIKLHRLSTEAALTLMRDEGIDSAYTIIALQWLERNRDRLRKAFSTRSHLP